MTQRRVAIVTGAARGIGAASARRLAGDGYAVALLDVAPEAEPVAAELPGAIAVRCDVGEPGDWGRAIDAVHDRLGPVDVLVSNALWYEPGAAHELTLESWHRQLAVEYGPEVRVNAVLPGPILTAQWDGIGEDDRARSAAETVARRLGRPEEVAAAVAFLAGPDASYITGTSLFVDGGWSITKCSS